MNPEKKTFKVLTFAKLIKIHKIRENYLKEYFKIRKSYSQRTMVRRMGSSKKND